MDDTFLAFVEGQFDPKSVFEFDLGMCLKALLNILDDPENWTWEEQEWFASKAADLIEQHDAKYGDWLNEYVRRKKE